MLLILIAPLVLYSLAPPGPLREGDTVFSDGEQRVTMVGAGEASSLEPLRRCLLDPGSPLIVIETPIDRQDGLLLAQVQGNPSRESPFCQPHARVLLNLHQTFQKPDVFRNYRDTWRAWFK